MNEEELRINGKCKDRRQNACKNCPYHLHLSKQIKNLYALDKTNDKPSSTLH